MYRRDRTETHVTNKNPPPNPDPNPPATPQHQHELKEILKALQTLGFCLPGSIQERYIRCQNPNCRCHQNPPQLHGPYIAWTRKVHGKTITHNLTPQQAHRYHDWFENNRRLRQLTTQLQTLSLTAIEQTEKWTQK